MGVYYSLLRRMSHPPTNSPWTYSWGIVGHSLSKSSSPTETKGQCKNTYENSLIASLSSLSSKTLYVCIFSGGTPCRSSTCMAAREKPHWGKSGVPFINRTTGVVLTASWIFALVSWERYLRASETAGGLKMGSLEARYITNRMLQWVSSESMFWRRSHNIQRYGKLFATYRNEEGRWRRGCNLRYVTGCWEISPSATTPILPPTWHFLGLTAPNPILWFLLHTLMLRLANLNLKVIRYRSNLGLTSFLQQRKYINSDTRTMSSTTTPQRTFPPLYQSSGEPSVDKLAFFHILERLKVTGSIDSKNAVLTVRKTQKRTGWVDHNVCHFYPETVLLFWHACQ